MMKQKKTRPVLESVDVNAHPHEAEGTVLKGSVIGAGAKTMVDSTINNNKEEAIETVYWVRNFPLFDALEGPSPIPKAYPKVPWFDANEVVQDYDQEGLEDISTSVINIILIFLGIFGVLPILLYNVSVMFMTAVALVAFDVFKTVVAFARAGLDKGIKYAMDAVKEMCFAQKAPRTDVFYEATESEEDSDDEAVCGKMNE